MGNIHTDRSKTCQNEDETAAHRAQQFCYYFLRSLEDKVTLYLDILESQPNPHIPASSLPGKSISGVAGAIPTIGKATSIISQEADKFILAKIHKKDAKAFSKFAYSYRDDREKTRKKILEAGLQLFIAFEKQFMEIDAEGGKARAMQKLALDGSHRLVTYILENVEEDISTEAIIKGVLKGDSIGKPLGLFKTGRTVKSEGKDWKTSKIFTKVGLCLIESNVKTYFKNGSTSTSKYGHRLAFGFEDAELIKTLWESEESLMEYDYKLAQTEFSSLVNNCWLYTLKQYPLDEARYERGVYHEEAKSDREDKHQQVVEKLQAQSEEATQHREEIQIATLKTIDEAQNKTLKHISEEFEDASKEREENLDKTLGLMKELHEETNANIKGNSEKIEGQLVEIKEDLIGAKQDLTVTDRKVEDHTEELSKRIEAIKRKVEKDDKTVLKLNKDKLRNHPDVKNVHNVLKKIGNIGESGTAKDIEREAKRIGEDLKTAEKKVRNFIKKL